MKQKNRMSLWSASLVVLTQLSFGHSAVAAPRMIPPALAPAPAAPTSKPQADYWKGTGLSYQTFASEILSGCYTSSKMLLACIDSLSFMASQIDPTSVVATEEEKSLNPLIGDLVQNLGGGLAVYRMTTASPVNASLKKSNADILSEHKQKQRNHINSVENLFAAKKEQIPFGSALTLIRSFITSKEPVEKEEYYTAILFNIVLEIAYDPHTRLETAEELDEQMSAPDSDFVGLGITYSDKMGQFTISRVMKGSGAMEGGVHTNDVITAIEGKSITGMTSSEISSKLKGPENSTVKITVSRGSKKLDLAIVRKKITMANVDSYLVNDTGVPYGYIKLGNFMDHNADVKIKSAIETLTAQGAKGLIVDLRDNGGGLLDQAVKIGSLFVGKKVVVGVKDLNSDKMEQQSGASDAITSLPMVTLINAGSASASEVLSGALQDHARSWVLGDRSFGKGSVQGGRQFDKAGKIVLFLTIQRFYQPSGRTNQVQGIIPDFQVVPFPGATGDDLFALREEDLYENALPPIGSAWVQPRPAEVQQMKNCQTSKGQADALYKKNSINAVNLPDYQLLVAEDVLNCGNK